MMDGWLQDARFAVRLLGKSPVFTQSRRCRWRSASRQCHHFSIASALLLRPLPGLSEPDRLVDIGRTQNGSGFDTTSYANYQDFRKRVTTLEDVYAMELEPQPMSIGGAGGAERVYAMIVTANYFAVLGTRGSDGCCTRTSRQRQCELLSNVTLVDCRDESAIHTEDAVVPARAEEEQQA